MVNVGIYTSPMDPMGFASIASHDLRFCFFLGSPLTRRPRGGIGRLFLEAPEILQLKAPCGSWKLYVGFLKWWYPKMDGENIGKPY